MNINLDSKTKNNISKIIILAGGTVIILILFIIFVFFTSRTKNQDISSSSEFKSVKEAIEYFGCEYYSANSTTSGYKVSLSFKVPLYNENVSYENYYKNLINVVARVNNYKTFELNDSEKNIYISVKCNSDIKTISKITINNEENFFENLSSKLNLTNYTVINNIDVNVQSSILSSIINNDWKYDVNILGSRESVFDDYDIFFDEGLRAKNIDGKIFNLVFTNKYSTSVINNIHVGTSFEEIKKVLGNPNFEDTSVIGYKTGKFYIFFLEDQISVYRVEKYDTEEFAKCVSKFVNQKNAWTLVNEITKIWPDYDYIYTGSDVINILYTLKGINIQFNYLSKHGIHIYSNFNGSITENLTLESLRNNPANLPNNIYIESDDLVYKNELKRAQSYNNIAYFYPHFKFLVEDSERIMQNNGSVYNSIKASDENNKFIYYKNENAFSESVSYIISKDDNNPSSQIDADVSSYIWVSDDVIAYSIENNGIYLYNAIDFSTKKIASGNEKFKIKEFKEGVLKYDNTSIDIK